VEGVSERLLRRQCAREWRVKLQNEGWHDVCSQQHIVSVFALRGMRGLGDVEGVGNKKRLQNFGWET
jgi:hypothetical protein